MTPSDNALKEISKSLASIDKSLKIIADHFKKEDANKYDRRYENTGSNPNIY